MVTPETTRSYKPNLTQEQFQALMQTPSVKGKSTSEVLAYLKFKGIGVDGVEEMKVKPSVFNESQSGSENTAVDIATKVFNAPLDLAQGTAKGVAEAGLNTLSGIEKFSRFKQRPFYSKEQEEALGITKEDATVGEKILAEPVVEDVLEPVGVAQKTGKFIGETVLPTVAGAKAGSALGETSTIAPKVAAFVGETVGGTTGYTTGTEGRAPTGQELAIGAAFDVGTVGIGKIIAKYAPDLFRIGANPKGKNYLDIEFKAGKASGTYGGTKKMIIGQAKDVIEESSKQMDEILDPTVVYTRSDIAQGGIDQAIAIEKADPAKAQDILDYTNEWVSKAGLNNQNLTQPELREIKSTIGKELDTVFARADDPKVAAKGQALLGIWGKIDEILNNVSPEVAKLNEQMNVAYSLMIPLEKDLTKPALQNFLSMLAVKNIPGGTLTFTSAAMVADKIGSLLSQPGVPEAVRTGVTDVLKELLNSSNPEANMPS